MSTAVGERIWFSTTQAAAYVDMHQVTVAKALRAGELHGSQRRDAGSWRIHRDCLDAWVSGTKCEHQLADTG